MMKVNKQAFLSMSQKIEHLIKVISSERFLKMEGLGNEIPFFICPYPAHEAVDMQKHQRNLVTQLQNMGIRVLLLNLYDLAIDTLKARGRWEQVLAVEANTDKEQFLESLQGMLDTEKYMIPKIASSMQLEEFDVMFVVGVGEVFPYIRSHNILNNLQSTAKEKPTVMFFPGQYTQAADGSTSLDLFSRLHDDKYYRAFNIFYCEA